VGRVWANNDDRGIAVATKAGNQHVQLTRAELKAFEEKLEPVVRRWVDEVKEKGIDGATLVKTARAEIAKYSK
jgi:hypothetical protein